MRESEKSMNSRFGHQQLGRERCHLWRRGSWWENATVRCQQEEEKPTMKTEKEWPGRQEENRKSGRVKSLGSHRQKILKEAGSEQLDQILLSVFIR